MSKPNLPPKTRVPDPHDLASLIEGWRVREGITGKSVGHFKPDQVVTRRDLVDMGIASFSRSGSITARGPGTGAGSTSPMGPVDTGVNDPRPPSKLTGLNAEGLATAILLTCDPPSEVRVAYIEWWRAGVDDLNQAVSTGTSVPPIYLDDVGAGETYYYWVRAVSKMGVPGPFNQLAGTRGETALDPSYVLDILQGKITETQLYQDLASRIDLIDGPATLAGSVAARIKSESDARESGDSANATAIQQVLATANNNTSLITAEQQARTDMDSAIATTISQVSTTVDGHTATIETQSTSIDGLQAQRVTKIDVDGYVVGTGLAVYPADDGTHTSAFIIRADRFGFVQPSGPGGTPKTPFIGGDIDGTFTVGIDGNLVVDGTLNINRVIAGKVNADKVNVSELSAFTANMGTLTSGTVKTGTDPAVRAELSSVGSFPFWIGAQSKSANNALLYVDTLGNLVARGITIYGDSGEVLLSSGTGVVAPDSFPWGSITGKPNFGNFATLDKITPGNVSTYIANAAMGTAQIAHAAVGTLNIQGQAVTVPVGYYNASSMSYSQNWVTAASVTINSLGQPIFVLFTSSVVGGIFTDNNYQTASSGAQFRLVRDGSIIAEYQGINGGIGTIGYMDGNPTSGNHTFSVQTKMYINNGGGGSIPTPSVSYRSMLALGLKR